MAANALLVASEMLVVVTTVIGVIDVMVWRCQCRCYLPGVYESLGKAVRDKESGLNYILNGKRRRSARNGMYMQPTETCQISVTIWTPLFCKAARTPRYKGVLGSPMQHCLLLQNGRY